MKGIGSIKRNGDIRLLSKDERDWCVQHSYRLKNCFETGEITFRSSGFTLFLRVYKKPTLKQIETIRKIDDMRVVLEYFINKDWESPVSEIYANKIALLLRREYKI